MDLRSYVEKALTATSTTSAPMRLRPSRPLMIVLNSRVDQPPVSGVPVAGATKSIESRQPTMNFTLTTSSTAETCAPAFPKQKAEQLTSWVQRVNIQAQVHRVLRAHPVADLLDDAIRSDRVNLARLDDLEAAVPVVLVVRGTAERRANAGVDVGVVAKETLLCSMVEVGAVVNARNLGGRAAKDLGTPCDSGRDRSVNSAWWKHPSRCAGERARQW